MVGLNSSENQISLGKNNTKTLTVPPIDLQYVLGKGQSESVAKSDLDDTSVDFIYSYFVQISGYSHRTLSGPYSKTFKMFIKISCSFFMIKFWYKSTSDFNINKNYFHT